jgi:two-component system CheB/CheR fusion protein
MAREGLAFELRNAIHKASKDRIAVTTENIPVKIYTPMSDANGDQEGQGKQTLVAMEIIPITDTVELHYLIRFEKITIPKAMDGKSASSGKAGEAEKRNEQLEKELAYNREDMRSITEDMEASNEELQSANEELQSSNEEMQSLNEELETSKEELQSTNEELIIVNRELLEKQEQLNAARYYAEGIVTTIREPLIILDRGLYIKTANASFYKKFNLEEKDIEGKLFYEIQNNQWDDHLMRSLLGRVLPKQERLDDFEINLKFPSLGHRTLILNARQINNEKTAEQLILLAIEDITEKVAAIKQIEASEKEQKKLARHLKLATDAGKVGVWSLDVVSSKLEWSNIHKKLWGYDKHLEDLTYEDWHKIIVPEDKRLAFRRIEESKVNNAIYEVDYRIKRANDGAVVWMKSTGQYQYDKFGEAHTLSGITIDITEQKSFTEELEIKVKERTAALKKSNEELKQSNLQLDQFAHIASHDLQEPIRKILTFSNLLQDKYKDGLSIEVKSYLNKIGVASSRMTTLIRDLLNYSKLLQHEKLFSTTSLNLTLENIVSDFELLIEEKKAELKIEQLPTVDAIPFQMSQLFHNLISNSLKFSKKDVAPIITITSRILTEKEVKNYSSFNPAVPYVEIIFKDNGIGFEQQYAKQIFTIFQRLHDKETYVGTGIGLAICKKIIENHQGEIFSNAKENEGALFHIILPLKKPQ